MRKAKTLSHLSLRDVQRAANISYRLHNAGICAYAYGVNMTLCVRGLDFPRPPLYAGAMQGSLADKIKAIRVTRGTKPQHYHLVSTNAPTIEDVQIEWAARVKAIIPA